MLLYLWVKNFANIVDTGFNLSSKYHFNFILDNNQRKKGKISGKLEFAQTNNPHLFNMTDIKAVIGKNGAGKTSLLNAILEFIYRGEIGFLVTDKYLFYSELIEFSAQPQDLSKEIKEKTQLKLELKELKNIRKDEDISPIMDTFLYRYSSILNTDYVIDYNMIAGSGLRFQSEHFYLLDYSLENRIVGAFQARNYTGTRFISGNSEIISFRTNESLRNLEFLNEGKYNVLLFKNRINEVTFRLNKSYERYWENIDETVKDKKDNLGLISQYIIELEKNGLSGFIFSYYEFFVYAILWHEYIHRNMIYTSDPGAVLSEIIKLLDHIDTRQPKEFLRQLINQCNFIKYKTHIGKKSKLINNSEDLLKSIDELLNFIINTPGIDIENRYDGFSFKLGNKEKFKDLINFYNYFLNFPNDRLRSFPFYIFSIEFPGLSSGEKDYLTLYSCIEQIIKHEISTNEILFMFDEPDVTFHPEWQREFVNRLNTFLPAVFPDKKIQVIVTSHSPIMVSDLPKENVLFLDKDDETGNCIVSELKNKQNTFGANIHTLYSDSFILKGGLIGEFAKKKINDLYFFLNITDKKHEYYIEYHSINETIAKKLIDFVGEPIVKSHLLQLYDIKFGTKKEIDHINAEIKRLQALKRQKSRKK